MKKNSPDNGDTKDIIIPCDGNISPTNQFQKLNKPNKLNENPPQQEHLPKRPNFGSSTQSSNLSDEKSSNSQQNENAPPNGSVPQGTNQNPYINISDISQIPHKGISQVNKNTFHISTGCCFKLFPIIFFCAGVFLIFLFPLLKTIKVGYYSIITSIVGILFSAVGIYLFFKMYNNIYFIMGQNTLTVIKKAMCGKKKTIYNHGELKAVEFNHNYSYSSDDEGFMHKYNLVIVPTNGNADHIFSLGSNFPVFTVEEIKYFLYYINEHIKTKMRV